MTITERIFALGSVPPFDRIRAAELALLAEAVRVVRYEPGAVLVGAGDSTRQLLIRVAGSTTIDGEDAPAVVGYRSLLFEVPVTETVHAGPDGATCLVLSRGHFFTVVNEIPAVIVGFAALAEES